MARPASRTALRAQIAPIAAITLFGISLSMSYPLFGLLLERMGASGAMIGLNSMAAAIAVHALLWPLLRRLFSGMYRANLLDKQKVLIVSGLVLVFAQTTQTSFRGQI